MSFEPVRVEPYEGLAAIYDSVQGQKFVEQFDRALAAIERSFALRLGGLAVDLGCGTGLVTRLLLERGYRVVGLDRCRPMLQRARRRCPEAILLQQSLGEGFALRCRADLVTCTNGTLNYCESPTILKRAFDAVHDALSPSGIFVFDVNTRHHLVTWAEGQTLHQGEGYSSVWLGRYEPADATLRLSMTHVIRDPSVGSSVVINELHRIRFFDLDCIRFWLEQAGLKVLAVWGFPELTPPRPTDPNWIFVASRDSQ